MEKNWENSRTDNPKEDYTIEYYNKNAEKFITGTVDVEFEKMQNHFLDKLEDGASILDFGCGSGRDTKYFLEHGMHVEATDGSEELCRIASDYAGIPVKQMLFQELKKTEKYDGIWACSSILHLPKQELKAVLMKMVDALKKQGIIYTSFKYGEFEGERNGRYFTDFTEDAFRDFVADIAEIQIEEVWITGDVRQGRNEEKWLNLIMRKN